MKNATLVPAMLIAAIGLFSAADTQASCQSICVRAYNQCLNSGIDPAACESELDACIAACGSGGGIALALNKDEAHCAKPVPKPLLPLKRIEPIQKTAG